MGLVGVFFAPFLHKNIFHLLINCVPFGILSMLVMVRPPADGPLILGVQLRRRGIYVYTLLTVMTMLFSGTLVWALGATGSNHVRARPPARARAAQAHGAFALQIGCSELVYSYFGYLVVSGLLNKSVRCVSAAVGLAVWLSARTAAGAQ
jgi:hypothetical protein